MPPQDSEQARWLDEQLRPHEAMLRAWLKGTFPAYLDVDDIVQEAYVRVLQIHQDQGVDSPKALLFATARNVVLMQLRHRQVECRDSLTEYELLSILDEHTDIPAAVARAEELELLTKAIQSLPTRCRQIITLRKIYGSSQKDIASQLGIAEHTVEAQGTIGLRKIAEYFKRYTLKSRPSGD